MLFTEPDAAVLLDALQFASAKHRDQRRQDSSGSPFVNHPIETAALLAGVGRVRDATILVGGILHDILEDTRTTPREIEGRFGAMVSRLVIELTDEPGLPTDARRRRQIARIGAASTAAKQIRLADKIANLRSLPVHWSRTDGEKYVAFAEEVAAAVRGINPPLDALFRETAQRARAALRDGRRHPPAPPRTPLVPAGAGGNGNSLELLRLLQRRLSKAEELVDTLVMGGSGEDPREPVPESQKPPPSKAPGGRSSRSSEFDDPAIRALAEPGIGSVTLRKLDARYVMVSIDGAKEFRASAGLAHLLGVLAFAEGDGPDDFTPFQSRREVGVRLEKLTGRAQADHTIVVAIGRLRKLLQRVGHVSGRLVETVGPNVRLRLRRVKP